MKLEAIISAWTHTQLAEANDSSCDSNEPLCAIAHHQLAMARHGANRRGGGPRSCPSRYEGK